MKRRLFFLSLLLGVAFAATPVAADTFTEHDSAQAVTADLALASVEVASDIAVDVERTYVLTAAMESAKVVAMEPLASQAILPRLVRHRQLFAGREPSDAEPGMIRSLDPGDWRT